MNKIILSESLISTKRKVSLYNCHEFLEVFLEVKNYKCKNLADVHYVLTNFFKHFDWIAPISGGLPHTYPIRWKQLESEFTFLEWLKLQSELYKDNFSEDNDFQIPLIELKYECVNEKKQKIDIGIECMTISASYNKGRYSFELSMTIDVFAHNPAKQPDVFFNEDIVKHNNRLLTETLKKIDNDEMFKVLGCLSDFYPDKVQKYGFIIDEML